MPKILERCVKKVKQKTKTARGGNAWAICTSTLQKAGKLPMKKNKKERGKHEKKESAKEQMKEYGYVKNRKKGKKTKR